MQLFLFICAMEHIVYILFSDKLIKYYIGYTADIQVRLNLHSHSAKGKFTHRADDWVLAFQIACESKGQALDIEKHIKSMKSKTYIGNLIRYPEMAEKLLLKYKS